MATISKLYGTKVTVGFGTALNSLASGSAAQSDAVDDGAGGDRDDLDGVIRIQITGTAGSTAQLNIFVAAQIDDDDTYAGGATGSAGSFSGVGGELKWLDSVNLNGTTGVVFVTRSLAAAFEGEVPAQFAVIIENASGGALAASGHVVEYMPSKLATA